MNKNGKGYVFVKRYYQKVVRGIWKQCFLRFQREMLSHVCFCEILTPIEGGGVFRFWLRVVTAWKTIMCAFDDISQMESVQFNAFLNSCRIKYGTMLIKLEGVPSVQTVLGGFQPSPLLFCPIIFRAGALIPLVNFSDEIVIVSFFWYFSMDGKPKKTKKIPKSAIWSKTFSHGEVVVILFNAVTDWREVPLQGTRK